MILAQRLHNAQNRLLLLYGGQLQQCLLDLGLSIQWLSEQLSS